MLFLSTFFSFFVILGNLNGQLSEVLPLVVIVKFLKPKKALKKIKIIKPSSAWVDNYAHLG